MSNFGNANSPVWPRPFRTWGFWETAFFGAIAYGVFMLTAGVVLAIIVPTQEGMSTLSSVQRNVLATQGRWQGASLTIASPPAIAVLWVAIREARREFSEYLALNWPSRDEWVRAVAITVILMMAWPLIAPVSGLEPEGPAFNPYLAVNGAGGLLLLLIGGCIAGPMMEEFIFRGFLFRGWSQSFLGPIGAIVLISILWALTHTQYDWLIRCWVFVFGLALGYFRWRSNSTWLTVIIHSATNILSFSTMGRYT